jgi:hypothetical protein
MTTDHPWTPKDDKELLALRAAGIRWYLIAKKLGRTEVATVSRAGVLKKLAEPDKE